MQPRAIAHHWPFLSQVDITRLRKIAAVRGLVNDGVSRGGGAFAGLQGRPPLPRSSRCSRGQPGSPAPLSRARTPAQLRVRAWPLMLGLQPDEPHDAADYRMRHASAHADSHVVACDMERSLWTFTEDWTEGERQERREALRRVLDAAVAGNAGKVYDYQGG